MLLGLLLAGVLPAAAQFPPLGTALDGVAGGAAAWADVDGDGDRDLLLVGNRTGDTGTAQPSATLYANDDGTFTPMNAGLTGVSAGDAAFGDYDDDGDPDLVITGNIGGVSITDPPVGSATVYENNGDGTFSPVSAGIEGVTVGSVAWGNLDDDGDLELVVTGNVGGIGIFPFPPVEPSARIYDHQGGGSFSPIGAGLSGVSVGSSQWGDLDNDGDLDLIVTGGQGSDLDDPQPLTTLYENDGTASFSPVDADLPDLAGGTSRWFDAQGDGALDLVLTGQNAQDTPTTALFVNDGTGTLAPADDALVDVAASATAPTDVDGDADVDLLVSGRDTTGSPATVLYENDGSGTFAPFEAELPPVEGSAAAWSDVDGDADPDLVLAGRDASESAIADVFENPTPDACPLAWSLAMDGTDDTGAAQTLTLGRSPTATRGLDPACNEDELPPPSGFDLRFTGTNLPAVNLGAGTHVDIRPTAPAPGRMPALPPPPVQETPVQETRATAASDTGGSTWRLALTGTTLPLSLTWDRSVLQDALPDARVHLVDAATGGNRLSVNMKSADSTAVTNPGISALLVQLRPSLQRTVPVADGWNLLSVPLDAASPSFGAVFPSCTTGFLFDDGYEPLAPPDPIPLGRGGFYNCTAAAAPITGTRPDSSQIPVATGWNLIGPLADTVSTTSVTSDPPGLVQSPFFAFVGSGGYTTSDSLVPGRGYWVNTSGNGMLDVVGGNGGSSALAARRRAPRNTEPPLRLVVSDAAGYRTALRWHRDEAASTTRRGLLPPPPPASVPDVRFATDRALARLSPEQRSTHTIDLQGLVPPVRLLLDASADGTSLLVRTPERSTPVRLTPSTPTAAVPNAPRRLTVDVQTAPAAVTLGRSRPNPAAGRVTIPYALPTTADVSIQVYDILGRRVARLVDGPHAPGRHRATLHASRLPSGVYVVRLQANGTTHTQRVTVVR